MADNSDRSKKSANIAIPQRHNSLSSDRNFGTSSPLFSSILPRSLSTFPDQTASGRRSAFKNRYESVDESNLSGYERRRTNTISNSYGSSDSGVFSPSPGDKMMQPSSSPFGNRSGAGLFRRSNSLSVTNPTLHPMAARKQSSIFGESTPNGRDYFKISFPNIFGNDSRQDNSPSPSYGSKPKLFTGGYADDGQAGKFAESPKKKENIDQVVSMLCDAALR